MLRSRAKIVGLPLLMLALVLAACGGSSGNGAESAASPAASTQTDQASTPAAGSEDASGSAASPSASTQADQASTPETESEDASAVGMIDQLNFGSFGGGSNPQLNYNPFSPNALIGTYIYDPLLAINTYACEYQPWLAEAYEWQDPQNLQLTIREGIQWSDGQPFTPEDVVFTMEMLKEHAALDTRGVWQVLDTVTADGNNVLFTFKEPAVSYFQRIATHTVVPKHIWEQVDDPVTFVNENPVVSGPFMPESFNQRQLVLQRNPNYWQADKVRVNRLVFTKAEGGNQVEQLKMARGEYDMNAMFIPNIEQAYVSHDPEHNHYWFPAGGAIGLGMNLQREPFTDVEFRRAMAYAINRDEIIQKAQFGYVKQASQTGLVLPNQEAWLPEGIENQGYFPFDQARATEILDAAGYQKSADGKYLNKDGSPMELDFIVQSGWTDWMQAANIVQSNLNQLGITVNVQTPTPETVDAQRAAGEYDMLFVVHGGSCNMYDNYYYHLHSESPPTANYIFHKNPEVDEIINQLRSAIEEEEQKDLVGQLATYSVEQFPTVPLWYGANWFQYSTRKAEGWPNADNPYAKPGDWPLIITNLKPSADYQPGS